MRGTLFISCVYLKGSAEHFVACDEGGMRVLISLQTSKTTVYFDSASREFLSVQQRRVSHTLDPPKQRAKDICNAFASRCPTGRRLEHQQEKLILQNSTQTALFSIT